MWEDSCGARKLKATIKLECDDEPTAEALARAISPDNYKVPLGLIVETQRQGKFVATEITFDGKLATFIATIDDLLSSLTTAEKTLRVVRKS